MIRRPPRSTQSRSSAASDVYKRQVDGIFFDDGYNVCGTDDEYAAVYDIVNQYEKLNHPGAMTVLNPGTAVPQCYEGTADVLLTFEGSDATYESSAYQALDWTPASPSEIWHIIYGVTASDVSLVDETSQTLSLIHISEPTRLGM